MKRLLWLSILAFAFGNLAAPCSAGTTAWQEGTTVSLNMACWHTDQRWVRYIWTSTPLWVPPDNKDVDGQISDDRRCMDEHEGTHIESWNKSEDRSVQMAHSWGTTYGTATNVLGLGTLTCTSNHTNSWSWACHTSHGSSASDNVDYTTPEGEDGHHDIEWSCSGTQYDGTEFREYWYPNTSGTLCHFVNLGSKTDKKQSRSVVVTAGDWHCDDASCYDGCDEDDMYCNGCSCTEPGCDHNPE
jgi:hypothetical protein